MSSAPIVVLGAAGEMTSIALSRFAAARPDIPLSLYDLDLDRLSEQADVLPASTTFGRIDLFDEQDLRRAIGGARLVVLGAGPYLRTAAPVINACLEIGVDYLDLSDDVEPTLAALEQNERARQEGVGVYLGCGASPGLLNVMVTDAANELDEVHDIDACWCTGDEGPRPYGAAVIEHLMHIAAGPCLLWQDGQAKTVESFATSERVEMGGGLGDVSLYTCAHPESATLPRRFPNARSIRVLGGLDPAPVNAIARGVAVAVRDGKLPTQTAVKFFQDTMQDKTGAPAGWRYAIPEMRAQRRRGETTKQELRSFIGDALRSRHEDYRGGLLARVRGTRDGALVDVIVRTEMSGPATFSWQSMGTITGTSAAAFMMLALERGDEPSGGGVFCPEDWVDPQIFYKRMAELGMPEGEVPTKLITPL